MPFEVLSSEVVFHGRVFDVRQDQVRLPNGRAHRLDIVDHRPAVTIIPLDGDGLIWFVRQYRHAAGKEMLEFPAGVAELNEAPETCAKREIREEIGMSAGKLSKVGEFFLAPGYSTEYMYVYLATDLSPAPLPGDEDEFLSIEKIHPSQVKGLIENHSIQDAKSLAGLFLASKYLF
jgi:ADP-ribose pyrophosphatase